MGNNQLDIVRREAGAFNDAGGGSLHARDGMAEGLIAAHGQGSQAFMGVFRCGGAAGAAARNLEQVMQGAVRTDIRGKDGAFPLFPRGGLEHGCPGAVPEQDAGAAVLPVDDGGKFFRGDDESRFHLAGADVLNGGLHGEQEAGAGGGNVKGGGILGAKGILDVAGSGRGERIRRDGGDDNQVNILRLQPAGFQSALGGLRPHMGSVLVRGGDAAFHNARAFNNPFVGSVHHLLQIRIGQAAFRNIGTRTDNLDGQSFKGNIRMCGHSFGRMMNRKRPDVLCGNSLKERGPDDQHKTQDSFHVVNEWLTTATPGRWRAARLPS